MSNRGSPSSTPGCFQETVVLLLSLLHPRQLQWFLLLPNPAARDRLLFPSSLQAALWMSKQQARLRYVN